MNPLMLELLPHIRQGYCCSQLLMLLMLQSVGEDRTDVAHALSRAMHGLCFGMGGSEGPCGLLTGGACVLGCVAGRGAPGEAPHPRLAPLVHDYQQWFAERTAACGGVQCSQVVQGLGAESGRRPPAEGHSSPGSGPDSGPGSGPDSGPDPALCGELLAQCWDRILTLLDHYDITLELR